MLLIGIVTFPHVLLIPYVAAQDAVSCWFIYFLSGLILAYLLFPDSSLKVQHSSAFRHRSRFLSIFFFVLACVIWRLKRSTETEGAVLHFLPLPAGAGLGNL